MKRVENQEAIFIPQEAHQWVEPGDTPLHSTWKSLQTFCVIIGLNRGLDGPILRTFMHIAITFCSRLVVASDISGVAIDCRYRCLRKVRSFQDKTVLELSDQLTLYDVRCDERSPTTDGGPGNRQKRHSALKATCTMVYGREPPVSPSGISVGFAWPPFAFTQIYALFMASAVVKFKVLESDLFCSFF